MCAACAIDSGPPYKSQAHCGPDQSTSDGTHTTPRGFCFLLTWGRRRPKPCSLEPGQIDPPSHAPSVDEGNKSVIKASRVTTANADFQNLYVIMDPAINVTKAPVALTVRPIRSSRLLL